MVHIALPSRVPSKTQQQGLLSQEADAFRTAPYNGNRTRLAARTDPHHLLSLVPSFFRGLHTILYPEIERVAEWTDVCDPAPEHVPSTCHALTGACALMCKLQLACHLPFISGSRGCLLSCLSCCSWQQRGAGHAVLEAPRSGHPLCTRAALAGPGVVTP